MLGGQHGKGHAIHRVGPGGEDAERQAGSAGNGHLELDALAAPDPVALHGQDVLRPVQAVGFGQQLVGVGGDAKEPLFQVAPHHRTVAAPAGALLHLLVGQGRLAGLAPVDRRQRLVGQSAPVEQQKDPLRPAVVVGIAGVDLALPVVGGADQLHLPLVVGRVAGRAVARMDPLVDGLVLGGQAKGIPAHRVEHGIALHPVVAADDVGGHIVAAVPHAQAGARRIGKEVKAVEGRAAIRFRRAVEAGVGPPLLPFGLDGMWIVRLDSFRRVHKISYLLPLLISRQTKDLPCLGGLCKLG